MTNVASGSLADASAARWRAASVPWWIPRGLLLIGWIAAFAVAVAGDHTVCSASDPGICTSGQPDVAVGVVAYALPVLLLWLPLVGCAFGVALGVMELFDTEPAATISFGGLGVVCGLVGLWLATARRRQRAIAAALDPPPVPLPLSDDTPVTAVPTGRRVAAVVCLLAAAGFFGWYAHTVTSEDHHLDRAVRSTAQVVARSRAGSNITVRLPNGRRHRLAVLDPGTYPVGTAVPLLVDPTDASWSRLVAEPADATGWETGGVGCLLLAALLAARELTARRAVGRLVRRTYPGIGIRFGLDRRGNPAVFAADDADGTRPLAVLPVGRIADVSGVPLGVGPPGSPAFARAAVPGWTLPATLIGDAVYGGWAAVTAGGEILLPAAPLRAPGPDSRRWLPGEPSPDDPHRFDPSRDGERAGGAGSGDAGVGDDAGGGFLTSGVGGVGGVGDRVFGAPAYPVPAGGPGTDPIVLTEPTVFRARGVAGLLTVLLGVPAALAFGATDRLLTWPLLVAVGLIWVARLAGAATRRVVLERDGLTLTAPWRNRHVPWERLHRVRRDGGRLVLGWDDEAFAVGPFAGGGPFGGIDQPVATTRRSELVAERAGAAMMLLRERALAAGSPDRAVTTSRGIGYPATALYLLLSAGAWWWHAHHG